MTKPSHAESRYPAIPVGPRLEAVLELAYRLPFDVRALLADYTAGSALAKEIQGYRERGQTDRLDELVTRLVPLLEGPEAGVLIQKRQLSLAAFEAELVPRSRSLARVGQTSGPAARAAAPARN